MISFLDQHPIHCVPPRQISDVLTLEISGTRISLYLAYHELVFPCRSITTPFPLLSPRTKLRVLVLITTTRLLYIQWFLSSFHGRFQSPPTIAISASSTSFIRAASFSLSIACSRTISFSRATRYVGFIYGL